MAAENAVRLREQEAERSQLEKRQGIKDTGDRAVRAKRASKSLLEEPR